MLKKLLQIQNELKCNKSQYNSFGKYSYRSCEDILEAVKPLLYKHNATIIIRDSIENIGDRFYVKATVSFVDCETGKSMEVTALAREEDSKKGADGSQVTGASSSYARKYALNGLFCIDDTKDADATNKHGKEETVDSDGKPMISPYQKKVIMGYPPETQAWACNHYGLLSVDEMSAEQATEIINAVNKKKKGA